MVCEDCQKKLRKVVTPDVWKAKNSGAGAKSTGTGRKLGESKLGQAARVAASTQYDKRCRICKGPMHTEGYYCNDCAYKKGICTMCGKKIMDTSAYKQSTV